MKHHSKRGIKKKYAKPKKKKLTLKTKKKSNDTHAKYKTKKKNTKKKKKQIKKKNKIKKYNAKQSKNTKKKRKQLKRKYTRKIVGGARKPNTVMEIFKEKQRVKKILEELEHAKNRGASILCEVRGYGISGDGFHVTSPDPNGKGAERAMRMALDRAGIDVNSVDYVNAHATSTPMGDEIEERTIARVAASNNDRKKNLYVSSTKGATGHLLGAAGAIEGAITAMTIKDGTIPPTQNLRVLDFQGFHHVTDSCIKDEIKVAVSNSFGFGGTNVSVVFTSLDF